MSSLTTVIESAKERGIIITFLVSSHYEELENHKPLDTTKIDTTPKQTATPHLTPEEMKQNTEDRIEIKSAPDVRTPNSFGPRRRPIRPARKQ